MAGNVGWEVTTPYGLGHLTSCNHDDGVYNVKLQWGMLYGVRLEDLICWRARVLPTCLHLLRLIKPGLDQLRSNLKSFSSIANKFVGKMQQSSEDQDWNLEASIKGIVDTFGSGNALDSVKLTLECQKENLANSLVSAKSKLVLLLKEADIKAIHDQGRSVVDNLSDERVAEAFSADSSRKTMSQMKEKIESALQVLYDVDLLAAIGAGQTTDGSSAVDSTDSKRLTVHSVMDSVSDLLVSAEAADLSSASHATNEVFLSLRKSLNSSYSSFVKEVEITQKIMASAVTESKSGQKLLSGGLHLKDRMAGLIPMHSKDSPLQSSSSSYTNVINAITKKISSKTSVRALATIRDKFVETVASSDVNKALSGATSASGIDSMLVEWYKKIFSTVQDSSLHLLAGKQLFETIVHAYTQVISLSIVSLLDLTVL